MKRSPNSIQSVKRALQILELINTNGEMSVSEISNRLNLERSTVSRLLSTMRDEGFLNQNSVNRRYTDGFKLVTMSYNILSRLGIRQKAYPYMVDLSMKCKESVTLSVMDKNDLMHIIIIEKIDNPHSIKIDFCIGSRAHSHCTAMGKTMLSQIPEESIIPFYEKRGFGRFPNKVVNSVEDLLKELDSTRKQGYGEENEEYMEGLYSIAVPILNNNQVILASLGISFPKSKYHSPGEIQYLIEMLKITCAAVSKELSRSQY